MSVLEVCGVVAGYGETEILHGVSITTEPEEIVTIIGPNGSGKSTLMKTILGLLRPKQGQVRFQGEDITATPPEVIVRRGALLRPPVQQRLSLTFRPREPGDGGFRA